ncbi:MAG TPA: HNH endonuclease signature motif containing protein [Fimbriiglobus sp.]|nr:HNH endonuclease signature motif containing protein [Fimbriiglobus sp.]
MAITETVVAKIMAKCARHCCICRRHRPLNLQVHHIDEQAEGGSDKEDNLIATCSNCHADVHTRTMLTRRFTKRELKLHRDAVYQLVADGKLPSSEADRGVDFVDELARGIIVALRAFPSSAVDVPELTAEATELLLAAATQDTEFEISEGSDVPGYVSVGHKRFGNPQSNRSRAQYRNALNQLLKLGLAEHEYSHFVLSDAGYRLADTLLAASASPPQTDTTTS